MVDSVITLKDQKFRKVKGVWVDQKKTPAPKDLIGLLDKLSAAEAAVAGPGVKEDKPSLPVLPIAAKDFSTAKLESSINRLAKIIENLAKSIEKDTKSSTGANSKDAPSAQRVYEPGKIPTLREAMKLNRQEFFKGTTNKYGEVEQRGLLRDLGSILPSKANKYRAQDRQRAAIGNELREYEGTLQSNPNLSKKQINEKIAEKRKELENPKAVPAKPAMPESVSSGEKERQKTLVQGKSEFASPELDKKIISVNITEINDSVLKKLKEIFGKGIDKEAPAIKEEEKAAPSNSAGADGGFFDRFKRKPPKSTTSAVEKEAEQLLDRNGKPLQGAAKASREAKLAKEAASSAENVAEQATKKPGILSKIFGGSAKKAGIEGAENVATKVGGSLLSKGLRGIPVLGAIAGAGLSGYETYKESGSIGKALFSGGGSLLGGLGGEVVGSAAGPVGTVVGGIAGSIGGGKLGEVAYDKFFDKKSKSNQKTNAEKSYEMAKPTGITPQTQVLTATTKQVETAKQQKPAAGPTVINNNVSSPTNVSSSQGIIGGLTVADRGSLNLASF
jgi:hypothetical protein